MNLQRTEVTVSVNNLIEDTKKSLKYRCFGCEYGVFASPKVARALSYELVTDADARFINLFGLSVDVDSGDIALGYFPNSERYVKISNIYRILREAMFGSSVRDIRHSYKRIQDEDLKFIIEDFKINPKYRAEHFEDIIDLVKDAGAETKYNSVILNIVYEKTNSDIPSYMQSFVNSCSDGTWVKNFINSCMSLASNLESTARDFFNNFIAESSTEDILMSSHESLVELLDARKPNLESLMLKYLSYDMPIDFLLGLKSYGFGIKQRKVIFPSSGRLPLSTLISSGERLSSLSYVESGAIDDALIKTYNIMDLLRATGIESEMLFSLEILKEKNTSLYTGISNRLSLDDILLECRMTDKDFITNITRYQDRFLGLIDRGCLYSRNVSFNQYQFVSFSSHMIESSGKVFQKAVNRVLKKF